MDGAPRLRNFIGGRWQDTASTETLDVPNPADESVLARVPMSSTADVNLAVEAARAAFPAWRETPVPDRAHVVLRLRSLLEANAADLARSIVAENGKTLEEATGSVRRGIEAVEFAASAPTTLQGYFLEDVARGIDTTLVRQPVGVVLGITPFNFPLMIPLWMAPLALVCGNTFILKPSERVPVTADRLGHLMEAAGFPAGTFNLVHGRGPTVDALLTHPGVHAVSLVGSAPTAEHVYRTATATGKRVQALAGAKNFLIVMPDADLEHSVPAILSSAFGQAGERCLAASVVLAVEPVGEALVGQLAAGVRQLKAMPDVGEDAVGPLIRPEHRERVRAYVEEAQRDGATLVAEGQSARDRGFFAPAVLFDHVRPEMAIAREEVFGPVLAVIRVANLGDAIKVANGSRFGNASAIFTRDGKAAREFRYRIEAGMLGVNIGVPAPAAYFPFVGWKGSFYGDLHATGKDAIEFYTRKKVVISRWF